MKRIWKEREASGGLLQNVSSIKEEYRRTNNAMKRLLELKEKSNERRGRSISDNFIKKENFQRKGNSIALQRIVMLNERERKKKDDIFLPFFRVGASSGQE